MDKTNRNKTEFSFVIIIIFRKTIKLFMVLSDKTQKIAPTQSQPDSQRHAANTFHFDHLHECVFVCDVRMCESVNLKAKSN